MIKLQMNLAAITPLNRTQIEHLVDLTSGFSSRIIFDCKARTINGKSMLGLLSLGVTGNEPVTLICEGEDEQQAADEIKKLLDSGIAPPKVAADANALMQTVKERCVEIFGDNLAGLYLLGSLAAGCFRWEISDIDFLVVVKKAMPLEKKMEWIGALYELTPEAPPKGLEMSVILEKYCRNIPYPIPFELHYSAGHQASYERDPRAFCESMHGTDPDLTAHLLELHAFGRELYGRSVARTFDQVKRENALRALRYDAADAEGLLHDNPCYYVLNLCRGLAYLREGKVLSKKDGGEWALKNLPQSHQRVIQAALNAYESGLGMSYDRGLAEDFCCEALEEINADQ